MCVMRAIFSGILFLLLSLSHSISSSIHHSIFSFFVDSFRESFHLVLLLNSTHWRVWLVCFKSSFLSFLLFTLVSSTSTKGRFSCSFEHGLIDINCCLLLISPPAAFPFNVLFFFNFFSLSILLLCYVCR
jgi:hypothetical protein